MKDTKNLLTEADKQIISKLQGWLPLSLTPYADLARELGMSDQELLGRVQSLKESGVLRRMGAVLYHRRAGYSANGMAAWRVPLGRVEEVGTAMAAFKEASHVYQRPSYPGWPYNLFTMLHGRDRAEIIKIAREISEKTGIEDYTILYSVREFKKDSMRYF